MELFEKIYSCYYQVVGQILRESERHPVTVKEMEGIIRKYGFQESVLTILPNLTGGGWAFMKKGRDGTYTPAVSHLPKLPLTGLQQRWLKSIIADRRISLFLSDSDLAWAGELLKDTEPLFDEEDFYYFDRFKDGDDYNSKQYRENFRSILQALEKKQALFVAYEGKTGDTVTYETLPYQLQYSSKDDKFRLCSLEYSRGNFRRELTLNLSKIRACHPSKREVSIEPAEYRFCNRGKSQEPVVLEISGERNSLERCMLQFANYEKHTEFDEERKCWICSIYYDKADETELLIDILSFGPVVRVLGPEPFLGLIKARVRRQHRLFQQV